MSARENAKKYGIEIGKVAQQTKYLETASSRVEAHIGRMQARMQRQQQRGQLRGELRGTLALGATLFAYPIKTFIGFEQAMAAADAARSGELDTLTAQYRKAKGASQEMAQ